MEIKLTPDGIELSRPVSQSAHTVDNVSIIERPTIDGFDMVIGYRYTGEIEDQIEAFSTDIEFIGDLTAPEYAMQLSIKGSSMGAGVGSFVKYIASHVSITGSDGTPKYISLLSVDRS